MWLERKREVEKAEAEGRDCFYKQGKEERGKRLD